MCQLLIADGDRVWRDMLTQVLSPEPCDVDTVTRGEEALQLIAQGRVNILITEVHLPDMPAWKLIPAVQQLDREIPVITITADDSWETAKRVRLAAGHIFYYGLKPLDLREIREVVRGVVRWRQQRLVAHGRSVDTREGSALRSHGQLR